MAEHSPSGEIMLSSLLDFLDRKESDVVRGEHTKLTPVDLKDFEHACPHVGASFFCELVSRTVSETSASVVSKSLEHTLQVDLGHCSDVHCTNAAGTWILL